MSQQRYHCRQKGCPNTYTDVVGGDAAFGKKKSGADCMPCFYAAQLIENGQTPEQIEAHDNLMGMMLPHLEKAGWNWADVKASYARQPEVM